MAKKKDEETTVDQGVNPTAVHIGGESIADRIVPHLKKILTVVGIGALVVSLFLVYRWWKIRQAEKSTATVLRALDVGHRKVLKEGETPPATLEEGEDPPFASETERTEAVLAGLRGASGRPRQSVALLEAGLLFDAGKLDEAEAAYAKLAHKMGLEGVIAREAIGFIHEARAEKGEGDRTAALEAALAAFEAMQPEEGGPRLEAALYHQGRILAQLGRKEEARAKLTAALDKAKLVSDKDLEELIEARIARLDAPPIAMKASEEKKPEEEPAETPPAEEPATP
jgi:tetratricopeptide (TPR) repeat protein